MLIRVNATYTQLFLTNDLLFLRLATERILHINLLGLGRTIISYAMKSRQLALNQ